MPYTQRLIESVLQTARSQTSGYQSDDEINNNIAMVESELMETLAPLYSINQKVQDLIAPFVTRNANTSVVDGVLTKPADYIQFVRATINSKPVYQRNVNEIDIINTSSTRKPKEGGPYYVFFENNEINMLPETVDTATIVYIREPVPGMIEYEYVGDDENDYATISIVREMEWPERAFNLLYYLLLEKFGVENENQLAMEYSQLGINKEVTKL